ncbi:hypothetical protein GYMLUDRAFT_257965, partial [Collybiopsis luxurians FD-317 M1]
MLFPLRRRSTAPTDVPPPVPMPRRASSTPSSFDDIKFNPTEYTTSCDPRQLLGRLKSLISDHETISDKRYQQIVIDICTMFETALARDEKSVETTERDWVDNQTFLPFMSNIVRSTIQCIEAGALVSSSGNAGLLFKKKSDSLKELESLRNRLEAVYFITMPYVSPKIPRRGEDALVIAENIGDALSALCDSVPILGMLKPVAKTIGGICKTIYTLRSNDSLAAEILRVMRDDFRMVVRKIQRNPAAQTDEDLQKDVNDYFCTLQDIIHQSLSKLSRSRKRSSIDRLRLSPFAQRDKNDLEDLRCRVQEARSAFQTRLALSMAISISTGNQKATFHQPSDQESARTKALKDSPVNEKRTERANLAQLRFSMALDSSKVDISIGRAGLSFVYERLLHFDHIWTSFFFFF